EAVASSSRGYQTSGTVMTRPSRRLTLMVSSVNWTSSTRSSALLCADDAEKLIPCLQKPLTRIPHQRLYLAPFMGAKSKVASWTGLSQNLAEDRRGQHECGAARWARDCRSKSSTGRIGAPSASRRSSKVAENPGNSSSQPHPSRRIIPTQQAFRRIQHGQD